MTCSIARPALSPASRLEPLQLACPEVLDEARRQIENEERFALTVTRLAAAA
jgi:hypothetical protein